MLTDTTPSALAGCTIENDGGKRWRIIGPGGAWEMTPAGIVTARQAEAICRAALAMPPTISPAATDVLAERQRQVEVEGWTAEHDDREHWLGDLAHAAAAYARFSAGDVVIRSRHPAGRPPEKWPWADEWWKPSTPRRELVKAAALLLAEIERIDRDGARLSPTADCRLPTAGPEAR